MKTQSQRTNARMSILTKITINAMSGPVWNAMTKTERELWDDFWGKKGLGSFVCCVCGFPVAIPGGHCDACEGSDD